MKQGILPFLILIFAFQSCTVVKRQHQAGWHVEWNGKQISVDQKTAVKEVTKDKSKVLVQSIDKSTPTTVISTLKIKSAQHDVSTLAIEGSNEIIITGNKVLEKYASPSIPKQEIEKSQTILDEDVQNEEPSGPQPVKVTGLNFIDWILEGFVWIIGIIAGLVCGAFLFLIDMLLFSGDIADSMDEPSTRGKKTYKSLLYKGFYYALKTMYFLIFAAFVVYLCVNIYLEFGLLALLGAILAFVLLVALLAWMMSTFIDWILPDY